MMNITLNNISTMTIIFVIGVGGGSGEGVAVGGGGCGKRGGECGCCGGGAVGRGCIFSHLPRHLSCEPTDTPDRSDPTHSSWPTASTLLTAN